MGTGAQLLLFFGGALIGAGVNLAWYSWRWRWKFETLAELLADQEQKYDQIMRRLIERLKRTEHDLETCREVSKGLSQRLADKNEEQP